MAIAIVFDVVVLAAFVWVKASQDPLVLFVSAVGIVLIVVGERLFMWSHTDSEGHMDMGMATWKCEPFCRNTTTT